MREDRFVVSKGDAGWRIYDRKKKDYVKSSIGHVVWYKIRANADNEVFILNRRQLRSVGY